MTLAEVGTQEQHTWNGFFVEGDAGVVQAALCGQE